MMENLLKKLRYARKAAGFRQAQAAPLIDATRTTIIAIEDGTRPIKLYEAIALCDAYGVTITWLCDDDWIIWDEQTKRIADMAAACLDNEKHALLVLVSSLAERRT